jgi:hypothetical protein
MPAAVLALLATGPALAASGHTTWEEIVPNQERCLETGRAAMERIGFGAEIPADRQTVFGWRGEDLLAVRCIADRRIAVIFLYLVRAQDADQVFLAMRGAYRGAPPVAAAPAPVPGPGGGAIKR